MRDLKVLAGLLWRVILLPFSPTKDSPERGGEGFASRKESTSASKSAMEHPISNPPGSCTLPKDGAKSSGPSQMDLFSQLDEESCGSLKSSSNTPRSPTSSSTSSTPRVSTSSFLENYGPSASAPSSDGLTELRRTRDESLYGSRPTKPKGAKRES